MPPVTRSIHSRLSTDENTLRAALLQCLIDAGAPVAFGEAGAALGWPSERTAVAAAGIAAKKMVVLDADGRVKFAYPVSTVATSHKVTLADGRTFYAMCAIDALGCCFAFGQPVTVASACQLCGEPLRVQLNGVHDVVAEPPGAYAVHVDLDKYEDWATKTWTVMNFFCTKNHYDQWCAESGSSPDVYGLAMPEAVEVACQLFGFGT